MSIVYLHLQSSIQNSTTIMPDSVLKFERTIELSDVNDISYNSNSGIIYLNQIGAYYVNWFVVSETSQGPLEFVLKTSDQQAVKSCSPLTKDQLMGSAVIIVTTPGLELTLCNGSSVVTFGDVPVIANLVIHSLDMTEREAGDDTPSCGTTISFTSGALDPTNPLTWPLIFEVFQISWLSKQLIDLQDTFTTAGLETLLELPDHVLSNPVVATVANTAINGCTTAVSTLLSCFHDSFSLGENAGLISMDAYIGHSTVGIVPAIASGDLPILSLVAGPPYPQIISRGGIITSFAAGYGALAQLDISLTGFLAGTLNTLNGLIDGLAGAIAALVDTIGSIGSILTGLGAPLPGNYADILNNLILTRLADGAPESNLNMHAVLWKGTPDPQDILQKGITWQKVSELDLGNIQFLGLGPIGSALSGFGAAISAGANVISSLLSLLSSRGTPSQGLNREPLNTALVSGLEHPISAGDYLIVQFTLKGDDHTTLLAGVLASDLMASVTIH